MAVSQTSSTPLTDLLFAKVTAGLCLVAPDGSVLRANSEWLRSSGLAEEQVLGKDIVDLFPEARDRELALHARARAGQRVDVPPYARRVDGRETWWEGSIEPVPMDGGTGLLITAREVLGASADDERYRSLFQHSQDAVYLALADGTILDANPAACQLHGWTVDEIKQAGRAGLVVNDERHAAALRARAATGHVRAELTVRRGDGSTVPVETESVLLDPSRPSSAAFVISRDISGRKRAEDDLRDGSSKLRLALEAASFGTYELDLRSGRAQWDPRKMQMWGIPEGEPLCYPDVLDRVHPDDRHTIQTAVAASLQNGEFEAEFRVVWPDGSAHWLYARGRVEFAEDGTPTRMIGVELDITARKLVEDALRKANEQLRDADRRKDEFLSMLSHELRNPLAPIRSSTYILRHAPPTSQAARRAQEVIERQTEHLTRLVDDLLDVTRIARGKIELRRSRVDLREVVSRAADDFRVLLQDRGVRFEVVLPNEGLWTDADATRITQVVGNLLHNATKFTRHGDEVTLSVGVRERAAEIRIRDTGAGIEPDLLPRIFDPFVQGEGTLARTDGGLGLGLALVEGVVELHGGSVRAESAGRGKGAEFTVRLPLLPVPAADACPERESNATKVGRRVLVVDDNQDAAESLADLIRLLGHSVEVAFDGPSAIEAAKAIRPDMVLCDIGLPGMNGYEVAKALRAASVAAHLVAVSGYAQPEDVARAIEAGFDAHLAKPADLAQIEHLLA